MYFNFLEEIDVNKLLNSNYEYYAHLNGNEKETLKEHVERVSYYFKKIFKEKCLEGVFLNIERNLLKDFSEDTIKLFRKLLLNVSIFHDVGKINPYFQTRKMDNKNILKENGFSMFGSDHSLISSVLYIDYFIDKVISIENKSEMKFLRTILFINGYIISKHHGDLLDFFTYLDSFMEDGNGFNVANLFNEKYREVYIKGFSTSSKKLEKRTGYTEKYLKSIDKLSSIHLYIYGKLVSSLLVASDYYGTSEFMNGIKIESFGDIQEDEFYNIYKDTDLYKSIRNYEENRIDKENLLKEKDINVLRSEMFLDAEKELIAAKEKDIFFLEAPTGSGKSNTALNLSFTLMKTNNTLKKIFYVYPFNTLVEQNLSCLTKIFGKSTEIYNKIAVINSIYPIKRKGNNEDESAEESLLDRQFLNYPMILTTHVSLFDTLFGNTKESNFAFYSLAGSVIVLDEIQSYKNTIWSEIITFLSEYCKILNMKVIIMSATLPELKSLINYESSCVDLIKDREKYFSNPIFKDRVQVNYDLLEVQDTYEELLLHVIKQSYSNKKILVEFITKKSAYKFYNEIKDKVAICELMSGDDNVLERKRILDKLNSPEVNKKGIVLVATQVIEAGVDIDMDIGYKDISKLDSEEQFMGRINRSCKKSGKVYFFSMDEEDKIYKNDIRIDKSLTLMNNGIKDILISKDFKNYYDLVLDILKRNYNDSLSDTNLDDFFINKVGRLNFIGVKERMQLIDDDNYEMSVFLNRVIEDNGKVINGGDVWEDYKKVLKSNIDYAEKQIRLSEIKSIMSYFIYKIKKNENLCYNDKIGELIYIDDGEEFFDEFKLDKERLIQGAQTFIL
ncbi:MAG: CRISPR-associated helicase Cas3' [Clostridium sp.]|nr:CRISPR-associated helicase Cas3' [Clostridium sp.]